MASGNMGWSDCGRISSAQFFYGNPRGRHQVGRCGPNETRTGLYAMRLEKVWKRLFKLKFDRIPSSEELWAVITTGEIAENVKDWEKEALKEEKNPPKKPHIMRGMGGKRMSAILADYVAEERARAEEEIKKQLEDEQAKRLKEASELMLYEIRKSSEVPGIILRKLVLGLVQIQHVCTLFGVDEDRVRVLIKAFGLKG